MCELLGHPIAGTLHYLEPPLVYIELFIYGLYHGNLIIKVHTHRIHNMHMYTSHQIFVTASIIIIKLLLPSGNIIVQHGPCICMYVYNIYIYMSVTIDTITHRRLH